MTAKSVSNSNGVATQRAMRFLHSPFNKANVLYKKYVSNEVFAGRERCLNFPRLEAECKKFNTKKQFH